MLAVRWQRLCVFAAQRECGWLEYERLEFITSRADFGWRELTAESWIVRLGKQTRGVDLGGYLLGCTTKASCVCASMEVEWSSRFWNAHCGDLQREPTFCRIAVCHVLFHNVARLEARGGWGDGGSAALAPSRNTSLVNRPVPAPQPVCRLYRV